MGELARTHKPTMGPLLELNGPCPSPCLILPGRSGRALVFITLLCQQNELILKGKKNENNSLKGHMISWFFLSSSSQSLSLDLFISPSAHQSCNGRVTTHTHSAEECLLERSSGSTLLLRLINPPPLFAVCI